MEEFKDSNLQISENKENQHHIREISNVFEISMGDVYDNI